MMKYNYIHKERELSSQRTNVGPMNKERMDLQMYNAWQPSLVLGGLGRARNDPYSLLGL
jgi:hypothetical protein